MGKKDTYTDVDCVRNEKFTHHLKAIKMINLPPKSQSEKNDAAMMLSCLSPTSLYACVTMLGCAPNETPDDLLPDLDPGITEFLFLF